MPEARTSSTESVGKQKSPPMKSKKLLKLLLLIVSYVLMALIVWKAAEQWQMTPQKQQERAQKEIEKTIAEVDALMILPEGEIPQVATIDDAVSLSKTQPFFTGSQNGDKILVYTGAKKVIVYRQSERKIVNVGPIVTETEQNRVVNQTPKTTTATTSTKQAESKVESEE